MKNKSNMKSVVVGAVTVAAVAGCFAVGVAAAGTKPADRPPAAAPMSLRQMAAAPTPTDMPADQRAGVEAFKAQVRSGKVLVGDGVTTGWITPEDYEKTSSGATDVNWDDTPVVHDEKTDAPKGRWVGPLGVVPENQVKHGQKLDLPAEVAARQGTRPAGK